MKITCSFCDEVIEVTEFDYAVWCNGGLRYCEECYDEVKQGMNKTRRV